MEYIRIIMNFRGLLGGVRASHPAGPGSILSVPKIFSEFLDVALMRFNDSVLLREWTVQSLIVVRTHLVLVSGKKIQCSH